MPRTNTAAQIAALTEQVAALTAMLASPTRSAPAVVSAEERRTKWRNKSERAAGDGFACECGRTDLRTPVAAGDFHNRPDGTTHHVRG